jgi:hypothetical protein
MHAVLCCVVPAGQIGLGRLKSVSLLGVSGLVPLVSMGPIHAGPGPVEGSSLHVPEVSLFLDPVQSLVYKQAVLKVGQYSST